MAQNRPESIHAAAAENDADSIRRLLWLGYDSEATIGERRTPLHTAAAKNANAAVEELIQGGASPDRATTFGATPLHFGAQYNAYNAVRTLIEAGAQMEAIDMFQRTPLHYAAMNNADLAIRLLLNNGARINPVDLDRKTPLEHAKAEKNDDAIKALTPGAPVGDNSTASVIESKEDAVHTPTVDRSENNCKTTDDVVVTGSETSPDSSSISSTASSENVADEKEASWLRSITALEGGSVFKNKYRLVAHSVSGKPFLRFAVDINCGESVVLKFYPSRPLLENTVRVHRKLSGSDRVYKLLDIIDPTEGLPPCLVFPRGNSTLSQWMKQKQRTSLDKKAVLEQILGALVEIHELNVVHCDLKPDNVMIFEDYTWRLIDMDSATILGVKTPLLTTLAYGAPEIIQAGQDRDQTFEATTAADMWSFGVIAFELLSGRRYYGKSGQLNPILKQLFSGSPLPSLDCIPEERDRRLLRRLLLLESQKRITARRALKSRAFALSDATSLLLYDTTE